MKIHIAVMAIAILILALGEKLPNETKATYIKEGYDWNRVLIFSNVAAFIFGAISILLLKKYNVPDFYNPELMPAAVAITFYIVVQSFMTDMRTFLINRNILRVSYLIMYVASIYNVLSSEELHYNWMGLAIFTVLLIILFIFSSIGASDIRAMAVALPYTISIGGYDTILIFAGVLFALAIFMLARNWWFMRGDYQVYKEANKEFYRNLPPLNMLKSNPSDLLKNAGERVMLYFLAKKSINDEYKASEKGKLAVGPFMILPFAIYILIAPILS